ncbi:MAG: ATPase domain-containing protein [Candidatus Aenigmatarchaeota archaeon]
MPKKASVKGSSSGSDFERIPSGIPGLDELMEGGFPKGSTNLVSGAAGTGKTIFCSQFIWEGLQKGESCMYITLEERPQDIMDDVSRFGWDFEPYIKEKKLFLVYQDPFQMTDVTSPLLDEIKQKNVQRVVIDSTAIFGMYYKEPFEIRKQLFKLLNGLKDIGVTSVITSELPEETNQLAKFGVEEFVVDGVIILRYIGIGGEDFVNLQVRKMRRTKHANAWFPMTISDKGIRIKKEERRVLMK